MGAEDDVMDGIAALLLSIGYDGVERTDVMEIFWPGGLALSRAFRARCMAALATSAPAGA